MAGELLANAYLEEDFTSGRIWEETDDVLDENEQHPSVTNSTPKEYRCTLRIARRQVI